MWVSSHANLDSSQGSYPTPTTVPVAPSTTTSPVTSFLFGNPAKYGGGLEGNSNPMPTMSTCNPSSKDACNGGQCVLVNGAVYTCRCRIGLTGAYCENSWVDCCIELECSFSSFIHLDINECASNPWWDRRLFVSVRSHCSFFCLQFGRWNLLWSGQCLRLLLSRSNISSAMQCYGCSSLGYRFISSDEYQ